MASPVRQSLLERANRHFSGLSTNDFSLFMNYFYFFVLIVASLLLVGCAASKKRKQEKAAAEMAALPPAPPPASISLSPGAAHIIAEIIDTVPANKGYHCRLIVKAVHGYGSSTPPLPEGSEIVVMIGQQFLDTNSPGKKATEVFSAGSTKELTIIYKKAPALQPGEKPPSWRMVASQ